MAGIMDEGEIFEAIMHRDGIQAELDAMTIRRSQLLVSLSKAVSEINRLRRMAKERGEQDVGKD